MKKISAIFTVACMLGFFSFSATRCKKDKKCSVTINVVDDSTQNAVGQASVYIYPDPNSPKPTAQIQEQSAMTDESGSVTFVFQLPAILRADVESPKNGKGSALVKLEEGKPVSKTIKVY